MRDPTVYAPRLAATQDVGDIALLELIDAEYTRRPFYGSRKLMHYLRNLGHSINRKRVPRLMRVLGLAGMAPGPHTSRPHPQHLVYPYLLRDVDVIRPNQVWSTDITCIRPDRGFVYLVMVIDWFSQSVVIALVEHAGQQVLCGLFGASIAGIWNTGDI